MSTFSRAVSELGTRKHSNGSIFGKCAVHRPAICPCTLCWLMIPHSAQLNWIESYLWLWNFDWGWVCLCRTTSFVPWLDIIASSELWKCYIFEVRCLQIDRAGPIDRCMLAVGKIDLYDLFVCLSQSSGKHNFWSNCCVENMAAINLDGRWFWSYMSFSWNVLNIVVP